MKQNEAFGNRMSASLSNGFEFNRHRSSRPPRNLPQIRFHVNDVVLAVPFTRGKVLQAIGLKS